eukprot:TRINITY_DN597_c0_g6_i1.p2 TRINITY_DN597_c0_g6~~TRINITY_DN597_c0_g6_i1.p2  ORF type:complete len:960 (+),score=285.47 TRINITY_DN597_c0_g6_i1:231-3110(+)
MAGLPQHRPQRRGDGGNPPRTGCVDFSYQYTAQPRRPRAHTAAGDDPAHHNKGGHAPTPAAAPQPQPQPHAQAPPTSTTTGGGKGVRQGKKNGGKKSGGAAGSKSPAAAQPHPRPGRGKPAPLHSEATIPAAAAAADAAKESVKKAASPQSATKAARVGGKKGGGKGTQKGHRGAPSHPPNASTHVHNTHTTNASPGPTPKQRAALREMAAAGAVGAAGAVLAVVAALAVKATPRKNLGGVTLSQPRKPRPKPGKVGLGIGIAEPGVPGIPEPVGFGAAPCVMKQVSSYDSFTTECTTSPRSVVKAPSMATAEGMPKFSFVEMERGQDMVLRIESAVAQKVEPCGSLDEETDEASPGPASASATVANTSLTSLSSTTPTTPEGSLARISISTSVPPASPSVGAMPQPPSRRGKRKKEEADPFQCEGNLLTIEFDLFAGNWACLDSNSSPQSFIIGANSAEQSKYLVLDPSSRAKAGPKPVYTSPADADSSGCYGVQYNDLRITTERLGAGAQGSVLKCYHKQTGKPMALKKIDIGTYKKGQQDQLAQMQLVTKELTMLFAHHESPHLVKIYNAFFRGSCLLILFEYVHYGLKSILSLVHKIPPHRIADMTNNKYKRAKPKFTRIGGALNRSQSDSLETPLTGMSSSSSITFASYAGTPTDVPARKPAAKAGRKGGRPAPTPVPERVIASIGRQCAQGLRCLHTLQYGKEKGLVHKDIKPGNILVTMEGVVKLADFGCCSVVDSGGAVPHTPLNTGTHAYFSPERLGGLGMDVAFGAPADIWALGVMLYEMALGRHPFPDLAAAGTSSWLDTSNLAKITIPATHYSAELREVLTKCLAADPAQRPTAEELLELPFFSSEDACNREALGGWLKCVANYEADQCKKSQREVSQKLAQKLTKEAQEKGPAFGGTRYAALHKKITGTHGAPRGGSAARILCPHEYPELGSPHPAKRKPTGHVRS